MGVGVDFHLTTHQHSHAHIHHLFVLFLPHPCSSLPSRLPRCVFLQGLKGVGGKVLILEEASRLNQQVFEEVVVPLLGVRDTAVLAISTPLEESNFYSEMVNMKKDDGVPLFNVIKVSAENPDDLPPWKTEARQGLVKKLLSHNMEMFQREQLGIITSNDSHAFDVPSVAKLKERQIPFNSRVEPTVRECFVAIDPAGGGESNMAICSGFFRPDGTVMVVGAEAQPTVDDAAQLRLLHTHFAGLRALPFLGSVPIVVVIESNMSWVTSTRIADILTIYRPIQFLQEDPTSHGRVGIWCTQTVKELMRLETNTKLKRENGVSFLRQPDFVSLTENIHEVICGQLNKYKYVFKQPNDLSFGKVRRSLTGKGFNQNDDLCIVFQMLLFWERSYRDNPQRARDFTGTGGLYCTPR